MPTQTEPNTGTSLQRFTVQDVAIAKMREEYMPLTIAGVDDKEGADAVHKARMHCVKSRTSTDKVAKELNAEAKAWIATVNGEAKRIIGLLAPIEEHLKSEEARIEAEIQEIATQKWREEEAARQAAEEAERAKVKAEQDAAAAKLAAERAEFAAAQRVAFEAQRKAEEAMAAERAAIEESRRKLQEAQQAEAARIKAEQDRIAAAQRAEQEKIEAERRNVAEEKARLERVEANRLAAIETERVAAERAERERVETEARKAREAEEAEAARVRAEALKPDAEKLLTVASCVRGIDVPAMSTQEGMSAAVRVNLILDRAAAEIRDTALMLVPMAGTSPNVLPPAETDSVPF
jgi:phage-related minor tail protein